MIIEYLITKMNLDEEIVNQHISDFEEREDAKVRIIRKRNDEAKIVTDQDINDYIDSKPNHGQGHIPEQGQKP